MMRQNAVLNLGHDPDLLTSLSSFLAGLRRAEVLGVRSWEFRISVAHSQTRGENLRATIEA